MCRHKFPQVLWTGTVGNYVKMNCPTVANGKVYVGTASTLSVWGLTNYIYSEPALKHPSLNWAGGSWRGRPTCQGRG